MAWVLDHLADLDADFLAIYRMGLEEAVDTMSGPRLLALCWRLPAYAGVLAARLAHESPEPSQARPAAGVTEVAGDRRSLQANADLAGLIDF